MPDIRHAINIDAPFQQVYPLISSGGGFSQWWAADVTQDANGGVELGFFDRTTLYRLQPVRICFALCGLPRCATHESSYLNCSPRP
ncbi:MAG TPA: hypothetical protein VK129_00220 [Terriglobales bacterium]|nr:hypothetical protein [Terriglobales bacterium]